jgi:hypothetical protein
MASLVKRIERLAQRMRAAATPAVPAPRLTDADYDEFVAAITREFDSFADADAPFDKKFEVAFCLAYERTLQPKLMVVKEAQRNIGVTA